MENQGKGQGQGSQVETPDPDLLGGSYGAGNYGMCGRAYDPRYLHPNTVADPVELYCTELHCTVLYCTVL